MKDIAKNKTMTSLERLVSKLGYKSMCNAIKLSKENPAIYAFLN